MISLDGSTMIEGNFRPHGLEYRSISFQTPYCLRVSRNHVKPWTVQTWKPCKPMESTETMENNSENSEQTNVGIFEPVSACTDEGGSLVDLMEDSDVSISVQDKKQNGHTHTHLATAQREKMK